MEKKKNIHEGHRKRLTDTVYYAGIDNLSDVQALEYILFFVFPRGDVNPLAHRLLDKFGYISAVLEAPIEKLMEVEGMGEMSSKKLHSFSDLFYFYIFNKINEKFSLKKYGQLYDYLEQLLRYRDDEVLYIFGVNAKSEVLKGRKFARGSDSVVGINYQDISSYAKANKVKGIIIVHNHPNGFCAPSEMDVKSYFKMVETFKDTNVEVIDSLIVGKDGIYSTKQQSIQRLFSQGLEYVQALLQSDRQSAKREN